MLTLFKKIFGKSEPKPVVLPVPAPAPVSVPTPMPSIEVAHLSLAAIIERLPDELKETMLKKPDAAAKVALPFPTILKQLPTGVVKMSLASLHRQAPGIFQPLTPGDKRTVDVPLSEVFRHIRGSALKRRPDQRPFENPDNSFSLFGDAMNPRMVGPEPEAIDPTVLDLTPDVMDAPSVMTIDEDGLHSSPDSATSSDSHSETNEAPARPEAGTEAPAAAPRTIAGPSGFNFGGQAAAPAPTPVPAPAPVVPAAPAVEKPVGPTLPLKLLPLTADWPAELKSELESFDPETTVILPQADVGAGLSKGRVSFTWAQIRAWLEPEPSAPTSVAANTALTLPLKFVAPAFLAATKQPKVERKSVDLDETIPALFSDGRVPEPAAPTAEETPAVQNDAIAAPSDILPAPAETLPAPAAATEPVAAPQPVLPKLPETVGDVFNQPNKRDWTPSEIVARVTMLPGVAGAIVALQEGLQVATSLPEGVKSDVVAAFLPQIFARLNQYAGEMRLGDVDDLLFTTHGAHCQIYRLGFVYFAVLGKPGETLPWHELRLISDELARQTNK